MPTEVKVEEGNLKLVPKCVEYIALDGTVRLIRSGERYIRKPGEKRGNIVDCSTGKVDSIERQGPQPPSLAQEMNAAIGGGFGDWLKMLLKPAAIILGKSNCQACEVRAVLTNAFKVLRKEYGYIEALKRFKDLWTDTYKEGGPTRVMLEIKRILEQGK